MAFIIGAPLAAVKAMGSGSDQMASDSGPVLGVAGSHPATADGTAFPLQQSAMAFSSSAISADTATNGQGAILTVTHADGASGALNLAISIPSLGVNGLMLTASGSSGQVYDAALSGGRSLNLGIQHGAYVVDGEWIVANPTATGGIDNLSAFITGYHAASLDSLASAKATATYSGGASGVVFVPDGSGWKAANLSGSGLLNADFGAGTVAGTFENVTATPINGSDAASPWNNVTFQGTIAGTGFSGQSTGSLPTQAGAYQLTGTSTGHFDGGFYGPNAQETGAVWSLSNGVGSALGAFALPATTSGSGSGGASVTTGGNVAASGSGIQATTSGSGAVTATLGGQTVGNNAPSSTPTAAAGGPVFTGLNGGAPVGAATVALVGQPFAFTNIIRDNVSGGTVSLSPDPVITFVSVDPSTGAGTASIIFKGMDSGLVDTGSTGQADPADIYTASIAGQSFSLSLRHLDYTAFGEWSSAGDGWSAGWVGGYQTAATAVPTSGSATYLGKTYGSIGYAPTTGGATVDAALSGDATLNVSFASGAVTGGLSNMTATGASGPATAWNDVSITASLSGAGFTGTTQTSATPASGSFAVSPNSAGRIQGSLYGPSAEEVGAVWDIKDGNSHAVGALAGKRQ